MIALVLLSLAAALGLELPVPTGPAPIGSGVAYLTDATRTDAPFPDGRPITLQVWYPAADASTDCALVPYLVEEGLARVLAEQGYYQVDAAKLAEWGTLVTHARLRAPPARGEHPLVTFSVGLGVVRANYTTLAEELASHGFIVALVESPHAGLMLRDDAVVQDTSDALEQAAGHRAAVDAWARDVAFALDSLDTEELSGLAAFVDWKRVAALGHSSGGLVAAQCAVDDARVRAAIDLDGGLVTPASEPLARFVDAGPTRPTLLLRSKPLYGDADFARRGITREQWEARGAAGKAALEAFAARAPTVTVATVAGTGHFSFSDAPFTFPEAITRFGGDVIEARRGLQVISGAIRAFLDDAFAAEPGTALARALGEFRELEVQARTASAH